jgi:hypothetical protein
MLILTGQLGAFIAFEKISVYTNKIQADKIPLIPITSLSFCDFQFLILLVETVKWIKNMIYSVDSVRQTQQ